jgi:hypothetical protein
LSGECQVGVINAKKFYKSLIITTTLKKDGTKMPLSLEWSYLKDAAQNISGILFVTVPR